MPIASLLLKLHAHWGQLKPRTGACTYGTVGPGAYAHVTTHLFEEGLRDLPEAYEMACLLSSGIPKTPEVALLLEPVLKTGY